METSKVIRNQARTIVCPAPWADFVDAPAPRFIGDLEYRYRTPTRAMPTTYTAADPSSLQSFGVSQDALEGDRELHITGSGDVPIQSGSQLLVFFAASPDAPGTSGFIVEAQGYLYPSSTEKRLLLREPLPRDVNAGSFAILWQASALIDSGIGNRGEGVIEWRASITDDASNTRTIKWAHPFWIVERIASPTLTSSSLSRKFPIVEQYRDDNDEDFVEVIETVWQDRIIPILEAKGIAEERIVSVAKLEPWHALECVCHLIRQVPNVPQEFLTRFENQAEAAFDILINGKRFWYDYTQDLDTGSEMKTGVTSLPDGARSMKVIT